MREEAIQIAYGRLVALHLGSSSTVKSGKVAKCIYMSDSITRFIIKDTGYMSEVFQYWVVVLDSEYVTSDTC